MDHFSDMPMPSLEDRVEYLLYYIRKNNIVSPYDAKQTKEIATQIATETKTYSSAGYIFGNIQKSEIRQFLAALDVSINII